MRPVVPALPRRARWPAAPASGGWLRPLRAAAAFVIGTHRERLSPDGRPLRLLDAQLTSTGVAVGMVGADGQSPRAVLKLPLTLPAEGALARETAALDTLHRDVRLGEWRALIPRPLARGVLLGRPYRLDGMLPGRPRTGGGNREHEAATLRMAARTIAVLHAATARPLPADAAPTELWVERHLRTLELHAGNPRAIAAAAARVRAELREPLRGFHGQVSTVHGDYWPGNVLVADPDSAGRRRRPGGQRGFPGAPVGIVDWESWGPLELPHHDVLHLLLSARRQHTGQELGTIVAELLRGRDWSPDERELLDAQALGPGESIAMRHALLLYWLRHAAMHARQQPGQAGVRYRLWERRNVLAVVAAL